MDAHNILVEKGFVLGGGSVRGFIFFRSFRADQRVLLFGSLAVFFALALFYPGYLAFRERQAVQALSWSVAGKTVVVDPGHGGADPGCVGCSGVLEKDINLEISKRLAFYLTQAGATAVLTRVGDYELSNDLEERVLAVKQHKADIFVSIHANSIASAKWWGAQTFYYPQDKEGQRLAALIQEELLKSLGESYRWIRDEDFYVLRNAGVPAVMVEVGFLSNPREERLLSQPPYQGKVAWCIYAGIVRYFAGEPTPPCPF